MTNTHNKSLSKKAFSELQHIWQPFLRNEIRVWVEFYKYWLNCAAGHPYGTYERPTDVSSVWTGSPERFEMPLFIVRYEDLLHDTKAIMSQVSRFLNAGNPPLCIHMDSNSGSSGAGYERREVHAPGGSLRTAYTPEDVSFMLTHCGELLTTMGYRVTADTSAISGMKLEVLPQTSLAW
eukprot:CAMPEP_0185037294 /NCGR_PEP_ID=MMETSP1103-20130426/31472_1 /TAXON_ID=36769 /ORGANISM="Paraphysomonas bandaiensis, Strain Caron Lab Isolate" /LENGTH=178 /DNA_ID=CAMNT_0027575205 /DNA_START=521 /DNA_END=1054 /DNA_ORIENTATION=-